jgi:hypothetical protein
MVEVLRMGEWVNVSPKEMTTLELDDKLSSILIDSDEFVSEKEKSEWYASINEAVRRLNKMTDALESVYKCAEDGALTIRESAFKKVCSALNKKVQRSKK